MQIHLLAMLLVRLIGLCVAIVIPKSNTALVISAGRGGVTARSTYSKTLFGPANPYPKYSRVDPDLMERHQTKKRIATITAASPDKSFLPSVDDFKSVIQEMGWEYKQFLGKGSFGSAYLVRDPKSQRVFVAKTLTPSRNSHESAQREWTILNNPAVNLGAGDMIFEPKTNQFILPIKYIPGQSWSKAYKQGLLTIEQNRMIIDRLSVELDKLHRQGLVHRDPAPRNVILRNNNPSDPVLIDFGRALSSINDQELFLEDKQRLIGEVLRLEKSAV